MNDSEQRPNGREDERQGAEDVGRVAANTARAEDAVRAMEWPESIFNTDPLCESELLHYRHRGLGVAISVWDEVEGARPDAPLTCEVMDEEKALHVLGVPAPGEVPGLLGHYADITESLHDGPRKYRVNLETGEVLTEREVERLLRTPPEKMYAEKMAMLKMERARMRDRLDAYLEGTVPALYSGDWLLGEICLGYAGDDRIVASGIAGSEPSGVGVEMTLVIGRETDCVVEVEGCPFQVHRDLAPGVPVPTTDEVLEIIKATGWRPGNRASS